MRYSLQDGKTPLDCAQEIGCDVCVMNMTRVLETAENAQAEETDGKELYVCNVQVSRGSELVRNHSLCRCTSLVCRRQEILLLLLQMNLMFRKHGYQSR